MLLRSVSAGSARTSAPASAAALARSRSARVLVIEDEPQVLEFVSTQLRQLGYGVTCAASGAEGLELLNGQTAFDLLFTDVVLGRGLSGVEIVKRARVLRPGLKVLLTSGYSDDVVEELGVDPGLRLLRKPYRRQALAEAVVAALQGLSGEATPERSQAPSVGVNLRAAGANGPSAAVESEARSKLGSGPVAASRSQLASCGRRNDRRTFDLRSAKAFKRRRFCLRHRFQIGIGY
jgi:CheY-like chemotaxis protein